MSGPMPLVLLVEDDANDRMLMQHAFRKGAPGMDLRTSKDSFEAEDYLTGLEPFGNRLAHPTPSLILLDLKMPRRSGIEFLGWLKERPEFASIPVIVLSSSAESADISRAYELGARSYLVKSVDLKELFGVVRGLGAMTGLLRPAQVGR